MNTLFGITNIKVTFFAIKDNDTHEINAFLQAHNGEIIDIQYQQNNFAVRQVMIVYKEK